MFALWMDLAVTIKSEYILLCGAMFYYMVYVVWTQECQGYIKRAITTIFHELLNDYFEDYVDDLW